MEVIEVDQLEEKKKMKGWAELCHTQYYNQIRLNRIKANILRRKTPFDGRWPLTEDDLWQKTTCTLLEGTQHWTKMKKRKRTFNGRQPLTEDDLWQKTTCTLLEGTRRWTKMKMTQKRKTTFDGRRPLTEDDFWQKTTFDRRRLAHCWKAHGAGQKWKWPKKEDDLWWNTTLDGRRLLTEDDHWRKTTFNRIRPLTEDDL